MKQTFEYYIYAKTTESGVVYELDSFKWFDEAKQNKVLVSEHEVTLDLPELSESMPALVAQLEAKKRKMQAAASAAIAEVDAKIQSLLAIEHQS